MVTGGSGFIGTNLLQSLIAMGATVLNVDIKAPQNPGHLPYYRCCDILDRAGLERLVAEFEPNVIVHLAARTDMVEEPGLQAYAANIDGVKNVNDVVRSAASIRRVLFASSKLVNKNGEIGDRATEYTPDTLYGSSKALGEQIVRGNPPDCEWAILRPTSIWGPWFGAPYRNFFRAVAKRAYFHMPGCDLPKRFGYVGNAVDQILAVMHCPSSELIGNTFYLADDFETTIRGWADEISMQLRGSRNLTAPAWLVQCGARLGDIAKRLGMAEPPLSSFRLRNLRTPTADVPLEPTQKIAGPVRFSQRDGVRLTLEWMGYIKKPGGVVQRA